MYKTPGEASVFTRKLLLKLENFKEQVAVVLCVPFVDFHEVRDVLTGSKISLGAQNVYPLDEAAVTGEISPKMLQESGVKYVVIGHSERRAIFQESNAFIHQKLKFAIKNALIPIFCIGETLSQRESNETKEVLKKQILEGLADLSALELAKVVIAYEPVWAIGTGRVATPLQAEEACAFIREEIKKLYGEEMAENIPILYGGSIKPENFLGIMAKTNIDGGLVGGASLKETFVDLVRISEAFSQ